MALINRLPETTGACMNPEITADAAGWIGIFLLDLPELLDDTADSN